MGHIVKLDSNGHIVYSGLLTSKEKATVDEILHTLKEEMHQIESDLKDLHGSSVLYKYYLGEFLGSLLSKHEITASERRFFWDEIKNFASSENRKRSDGSYSVTRSFHEQCFVLSQYDVETVKKLSWRQWQDLLDRVGNREDERIFSWIKNKDEKIREDDWREFEKGLHQYLKSKDTSVFSDDELYDIYDSILDMCKFWRLAFIDFSRDYPKSAKISRKAKYSSKYHATCFQLKKELRKPLNEEIFSMSFKSVMK